MTAFKEKLVRDIKCLASAYQSLEVVDRESFKKSHYFDLYFKKWLPRGDIQKSKSDRQRKRPCGLRQFWMQRPLFLGLALSAQYPASASGAGRARAARSPRPLTGGETQ